MIGLVAVGGTGTRLGPSPKRESDCWRRQDAAEGHRPRLMPGLTGRVVPQSSAGPGNPFGTWPCLTRAEPFMNPGRSKPQEEFGGVDRHRLGIPAL